MPLPCALDNILHSCDWQVTQPMTNPGGAAWKWAATVVSLSCECGRQLRTPDRLTWQCFVLKAQKLSPTPPGQMSVLQDSHSDTHMQTNTHAMIPRDRQGTSRVYWCVSPARANIRFWHQNQHCWRASTPALFELTEAHSTSLESYSWDKDNNGFLVFECL